jgi:hypothetical protein
MLLPVIIGHIPIFYYFFLVCFVPVELFGIFICSFTTPFLNYFSLILQIHAVKTPVEACIRQCIHQPEGNDRVG